MHVSRFRIAGGVFIRHGKLCDFDGKLFCGYDVLHNFYRADDDFLSDGDAAASAWKGNAMYGVLFEVSKGFEYVVVLFAGVVSLGIAVGMRGIFKGDLLDL